MHGKVLFRPLDIVVIIAFATAVITSFRRFFYTKGIVYFRHLIFFCIVGAGPVLCSLVLLSNYYFKTSYNAVAYPVVGYEVNSYEVKGVRETTFLFQLKGNVFETYPNIRQMPLPDTDLKEIEGRVYLGITTSRGIWGLENFEGNELLVYRPADVSPGSTHHLRQ
jgi:hypothetical protein